MKIAAQRLVFGMGVIILTHAGRVWAADSICPTGYEGVSSDVHHSDAYATSAPEVKVRSGIQSNSSAWRKIIRPLIAKAVDQAKAKRASAIESGIENACAAKQQYTSQIVPFEERPSGCDYRVVNRLADPDHVWVLAIAFCKYDWNCCRPTVAVESRASETSSTAGTTSFTLEGPLNPEPSTTTARPSQKSRKP
jgi:hypothetical protein